MKHNWCLSIFEFKHLFILISESTSPRQCVFINTDVMESLNDLSVLSEGPRERRMAVPGYWSGAD